jgi:putative membrane protein
MLSVSWWCSATGQAWSWQWRAYPGVWVFVLALAAAYARVAWRRPPPTNPNRHAGRRRWLGVAGLAMIWVLLDWPVGTLGSGYLMAVHAAQFLLFSFVVPPLLYAGVGPYGWQRLDARLGRSAPFNVLSHPLVTGIGFNLMAGVTHVPSVVDGLMRTQLGAFAIDLVWIGGGVAFWWPVLARFPT